MGLNGVFADEKLFSDLMCGLAGGNAFENFLLPAGNSFIQLCGLRMFHKAVEQSFAHFLAEIVFARMKGMDRCEKVLFTGIL